MPMTNPDRYIVRETLTLDGIAAAFRKTLLAKATPHREPDFDYIRKAVGLNPTIRGWCIFLEEYNTGYDGPLERWSFRATDPTSGQYVSFYADLLPGIVSTEKAQ